MFSNDEDSNVSGTLAALIAGIGIGFGLGILFAPDSGRRTRRTIAKTADRSLSQLKDHVEDIRSSASDLIDKSVKTVQTHTDTVARGIDSAKKAYRGVVG